MASQPLRPSTFTSNEKHNGNKRKTQDDRLKLWNSYSTAAQKHDRYAEVFVKDGSIVQPYNDNYRLCSINRWYDADCVPAIIRHIEVNPFKMYSEADPTFVIIPFLFGNGQYLDLSNGTEVTIHNPNYQKIEQYFAVHKLDGLVEYEPETSPYWTSYGQARSGIGVGGTGENGRKHQNSQEFDFGKDIFKFCYTRADYGEDSDRTAISIWFKTP